MALLHLDHIPETVGVNLPLNVLLPDPGRMGGIPVRSRKLLYLLHGLSDDASAWPRYSTVETLAAAYGLVVVMPSVGRSFYADLPNGQRYFTYLTDELPRYLADVFGLAPGRAETLVAGNSMGGYGAFKLAFAYPERFAAAASFSGVLSLEFLRAFPDDPRREEFRCVFGDLEKLAGGPHDPATWYRAAALHPERLPRLFLACGRQEDLYPLHRMVCAAFQELGIPADIHEEDARHDWSFWGGQLRRFLAAVLGPVPAE